MAGAPTRTVFRREYAARNTDRSDQIIARRKPSTLWTLSFKRTLNAMTRTTMRAGSQAIAKALRATAKVRKPANPRTPAAADWISGVAIGAGCTRHYRLFKPTGVRNSERLPLIVMLHGCAQNAEAIAASSRINRIAARERFLVLYPEQNRLSNVQNCWNWYETKSGRAQAEMSAIDAAIEQVCLRHAVDRNRIALAGFSAGAAMAALLAMRHPERYRAIIMHSGVGPGVAHSTATALGAMRGRRINALPYAAGVQRPALLVIHGSADHTVAPGNGVEAARAWAASAGAKACTPRIVQRGARYPATVTEYRTEHRAVSGSGIPGKTRLVATHCEIAGLGHAWSGGAAGHPFSDPKGPDASRMIWAFVVKQFGFIGVYCG
jgi:poly(hydroxyalkanoate) depolymerase family esterase